MKALSLVLFLAAFLACGCASWRGTESSTASTSMSAASAYWFRGTPQSLRPVLQGDLVVNTPLANGGTLTFTTWYNAQLTNSTGDAIISDGNGGQATEIDLVLNYAQTFGGLNVSAGVISYSFPNADTSDFATAPTKEFYLGGTLDLLGLAHSLTLYYDLDLLDDYYLSYQASRSFKLNERLSAAVAFLLGYMSDDQAAFYFGTARHGFSDALLTGSLSYACDDNTSLFVKVAGVGVPSDYLEESLEANSLDSSGAWAAIGFAWGL